MQGRRGSGWRGGHSSSMRFSSPQMVPVQGGLYSSIRLRARARHPIPASIYSFSSEKRKTRDTPVSNTTPVWKTRPLAFFGKAQAENLPRMCDLPKICQPLQSSNFLHDHSHMKNEMKPHGNLWHFYYYAMFGWKKILLKFSFPSRVSLEKLFLAFFNYMFHH